MHSPTIQKLIDLFSKFPTVGPRTASRFVFYLLKLPKEKLEKLTAAILELKNKISICQFCFNPFEASISANSDNNLCEICSNRTRDRSLLCLVEKETDLISLEKTKKYNGLYFILGGTASALKKEDVKKIRTNELVDRIKEPEKFGLTAKFQEIIIATNPTTEGETTMLYLERLLKPLNIKTSRLARGLPTGGELEYADEETLKSALEGRK